MQVYKALYPDKAQDTIFGLETIGEKSREKKDLDAMEIDKIQRKEGKSLRYCQIYAGKGFKNKSKTYNTVDCYDKPSNENKHPYKTSSQKPSLPGPSKNKNQSFRAQLIKMLEKNSNNPDFSSENVKINSASIEKIPDIVCNKTTSFKISVILWVYRKKVQTKALVDSGATTNFVNRVVIENNNLVTYKLANPYCVINADGTPNKAGYITEYVQAYVEIGLHRTTQHLFVTNLGNKEMIIGYLYLYKYNPNIDWQKGQWEFTRCPDICTSKAYKIRDVETGANELYLELDVSRSPSLDDIGDEDPNNHILSWADTTDPGSHQQAMMIAAILNN